VARARLLPILIALLAGAATAAPAHAAPVPGRDYDPHSVLVHYADGRERSVKVPPDRTVTQTIATLERRGDVTSARPQWLAHASFIPNDPGRGSGWAAMQWNLTSPIAGIDAPTAWDHLNAVGRPGGARVVVAVLDTGVAYRDLGRYKRSPDLNPKRFRRGYDFVDDDPYPVDENGHGTHVASTIAETANNGIGLTGVAYGATILPVRVLDAEGEGRTTAIAKGIRFAVDRGANVINLSFEFGAGVLGADIPNVMSALRYARHKGVLVVGAAGNEEEETVAYPARASMVLAVGATTEHGCRSNFSNEGAGLDLVAPGGGPDARIPGDPNCRPGQAKGADIYQMTYRGSSRRLFGFPSGYVGTSMAAPHVSATAALVIASGVLGPKPTPDQITRRLEQTARDLGVPGPDPHYGAGLVDAGRATDPAIPVT